MTYNANNAKEVTQQSNLEKNHVYDTVIVNMVDGIVDEFLDEKVKPNWQGDLKGHAINVVYQIPTPDGDKEFAELSQVFTYNVGEDGSTEYSKTSNLAKYKKQYGKLPEVGDKIKVLTNSDGKPKILIA